MWVVDVVVFKTVWFVLGLVEVFVVVDINVFFFVMRLFVDVGHHQVLFVDLYYFWKAELDGWVVGDRYVMVWVRLLCGLYRLELEFVVGGHDFVCFG